MGTSRQPMTPLVVMPGSGLEDAHLGRARLGLARQEALRHPVVALQRQLDAVVSEGAIVVRVGDLDEDAGAIARLGIAAGRAPVRQATQNLDPHAHDLVRGGRCRSATKPSPQASCSKAGS